jgi:predicted nucleotidyltransferase
MNEDPNLTVVSLVVRALGSLRDEFMLVGGCAVGLLITDPARPPVRQTADVDLVAEIASIKDYYSLRPRLNEAGFKEDPFEDHMCRWRKGDLIVDVMPTTEVLGHSVNRWYANAVKVAEVRTLPSGEAINVITAPYFIATKLESFNSRGGGDYMHHDMEDVLTVVDGREELLAELASAPVEVRDFIQDEMDGYLADQTFVDQLEWVFPDGRAELLIKRLRRLAGL